MRFCEHVGTPLTSFVDLFFLFVFVFDILPCLCLTTLWSPAGKGLTSCVFCYFSIRCPGSGVVLDCIDS